MKRPFVVLSIALVLGILIGYYFKIDLGLLVVLIGLFILGILLARKLEIKTSLGLIFLVFLLGIFIMTVADMETIESYRDRDITIRGTIVAIDRLEDEYGRFILRTESLKTDTGLIKKSSRILLTTEKRDLAIGDEILLRTKLKLPSGNTNPLLFNYRNYLRGRSIRVTGYGSESDIELLARTDSKLLGLKDSVYKRLDKSFSILRPRNGEFLSSLILGTSSMEDDDTEGFRDLGLAHVLAVSGLHLGIITSFIIILLTILLVDRKLANLIALVFIVLYTYFIDFSPSIMRAGIMMSIYLISINFKKYSDPINDLFFVSFVLSVINPYIVFSLSFQLSFFASLSIFIIVERLKKLSLNRRNKFVEGFLTILGVQIGLLAIQAYYFNSINLLAILANFVVVPIVSIILPLGFILFSLPSKLSIIAYSLGVILDVLIDLVFYIKDYLSLIDITRLKLASPSILGIFIYYLVLLVCLGIIRIDIFPRDINKLIILSFIVILGLNIFSYNYDRGLSIEFIDVDQGDSSLVRYRNKNYLIDTGGNVFKNFDIGRNIVIPYLEKTGVKKLDGVFISHFDADHCKSLVDIMDEIEISKIYIGYEREENNYYRDITSKAKILGIPVKLISRGDRLLVSDDFYIDVVYPEKDIDNKLSDNDLSLVLELNYHGVKTLFTGDIEALAENYLVASRIGPSQFLKVPHHGSKTSSSLDLIRAVEAENAFIQVGRDNSFSHPNEEVLGRYKAEGVEIYRTDELGLISLFIGKEAYRITGFLRDKYSIIDLVIYYRYRLLFYVLYLYILFKLILLYRGSKELDSFEF